MHPTAAAHPEVARPRAGRPSHRLSPEQAAASSGGLYRPDYEHDACGIGFIAHIKGVPSHAIVQDALIMLQRMDHRGACGCENNTGDGAGILTAIPHDFLSGVAAAEAGLTLPDAGMYGVGNVFFPQDEAGREACRERFTQLCSSHALNILGWRKLPQDADRADVGPSARRVEPWMEQVFVVPSDPADAEPAPADLGTDALTRSGLTAFDRSLFLARKQATHAFRHSTDIEQADWFYVCSLSPRVIVYKGQLTSGQVPAYYSDLRDERYVSHLGMVHSRFSTNTFPSWDRAQPCRFMSHNGEINTVRGNANWLSAREGLMHSDLFGEGELEAAFPIVEPDLSDSGTFDNCLELLLMAGRSLPEAVMMMIPEAWENHRTMPEGRRNFYEYHANLMEPWDGPASISFTDGRQIGAVLDRNGLRPSRYYVTDDDRVIMASEVGVLDVDPQHIVSKGRLQPGRMFLVDFEAGRIVPDEEIKATVAAARPYGEWIAEASDAATKRRSDEGDGPALPPSPERPISSADEPRASASPPSLRRSVASSLLPSLRAFGYTHEHLHMLMLPMVQKGQEAIGSMGNDAALACLSDKPRLLYDYFKQLFAQVTNPPIDPIREEIIMSLQTRIGSEGNLLATTPQQCRRVVLDQPILTNDQLVTLREGPDTGGSRTRLIDITYEPGVPMSGTMPSAVKLGENGHAVYVPAGDASAMKAALDRICREASDAIASGKAFILLSDRNAAPGRVPLPSLLATGAVHHHLIRRHERTRVGILLESGEAREVHHFCLLFGYGADAVNPYLAFAALDYLQAEGMIEPDLSPEGIRKTYIKAIGKGILKVMSKMGISTLASYKGAQIFEAVGLRDEVIHRCFTGTASRLQGVGWDVLATEAERRHALGFGGDVGATGDTGVGDVGVGGTGVPPVSYASPRHTLPNPGEYHWRPEGERHAVSPQSIAHLQAAARSNSRGAYEKYAALCDGDARQRCTLRGLLRLKKGPRDQGAQGPSEEGGSDEAKEAKKSDFSPRPLGPSAPGPLALEEVQPAADIVKRFRTGAMSLGALSREAHETLAVAMNRIGGMSNSGEGGEDPVRFNILDNGDSKRSAIKQVASGRFGVTSFYLANADSLQIKIAQGAKPGEGGQLPGFKVDEYIASIRHSTPGVGLISPPPHHDIYSIEDLAQLIYDLKNSNPDARVSVKLVSEVGVGTVAAGVAKAHADHILISGHDGGTGASPLTSIKHAGLPWELGLAETHQTLVANGLRDRVHLETDGGFRTGRDVVIAAILGAEEFGFSTAPLIAVGCIMMRKCHLNTCPVGVCTQDPVLRKKFLGQPEHVINYLFLVAEEARRYMAQLGVRTIDELVGRTDLLEADDAIEHWKTDGIDLTPLLVRARDARPDAKEIKCIDQDHGLDHVIDRVLIRDCEPALAEGDRVTLTLPITNTDRAVGTMLSYQVSKRIGASGLPDDTITLHLGGSAGQSLGAWLAHGITIHLRGDANDYVGKGLSGGRIIIQPPEHTHRDFVPEVNMIIGNVALYGATSGECYIRGMAAERFAVRNSGALTVVEGVGDHGCEYMTGGRVVVLGPTGRNFAAGMSGGIAYIHDPHDTFRGHCNPGMVDVEEIESDEEADELRILLERHHTYTDSTVAEDLLARWYDARAEFAKVMPIDYRRVLLQRRERVERVTGDVGHG